MLKLGVLSYRNWFLKELNVVSERYAGSCNLNLVKTSQENKWFVIDVLLKSLPDFVTYSTVLQRWCLLVAICM